MPPSSSRASRNEWPSWTLAPAARATSRNAESRSVRRATAANAPWPRGMGNRTVRLVGEQAAAGHIPLWAAVLAFEAIAVVGTTALFLVARGPGHAFVRRVGPRVGLTEERLRRITSLIGRRGRPALAIGRGTPGLRTVTVVAAGGTALEPRRSLPALVLGSSVFLQLHLILGYLLGPAARDAIADAKGPATVVIGALVAAAVVFWLVRRGRRGGAEAMAEAAC